MAGSGGGSAECVGSGVVIAEAVAVAVEVEHDGSVEEAVEHGGGDGGVAEDFAPSGHAAVGCDHDARFEVALGRDLEQCDAASAGNGK